MKNLTYRQLEWIQDEWNQKEYMRMIDNAEPLDISIVPYRGVAHRCADCGGDLLDFIVIHGAYYHLDVLDCVAITKIDLEDEEEGKGPFYDFQAFQRPIEKYYVGGLSYAFSKFDPVKSYVLYRGK